ncbi:hypothetical protein GQ651_09315 [Alphaproteobacteria bacterium GH1-50]|uniref:Winged helix domain-containing protein n=1 Tax=Kangsaoukella pontilimi TaxID=2691042 RepID=A0A7C9J3A4_9RHOB|nr:hypothetical protein [Kangsaoukella pontilimi]MXQ08041.1 hypothetical protein [Kangsaoukella pontilimi]
MKLSVTIEGYDSPIALKGRTAWALQQLIIAGSTGVSTVDRPAPRWSAYVEKLRKKGIHVDTKWERHGGAFPGRHGVYVLRSVVQIEAA